MTFREAVLASILLHAFIALVLVLVPEGTLGPGSSAGLLLGLVPQDDRIPMAFVQDAPRPPEPNPEARLGSDRDRRRAQQEQPENPSEIGPFSRGNTPAMIAEGAIAPPSPGPPAPPPPPEVSPEGRGEPAAGVADARKPQEAFDRGEGAGRLYVRPPREGEGTRRDDGDSALEEKGARLRRALSQMGASGSVGAGGGVPYRFDNPTAGLSTPSGTLSFDTEGFDWGPYARRIYWIIWSNWHTRMPPAIYTGLKGAVTVRFVIERDGTIRGIQVLSESGVPAYDNAAMLALEASSPLPPLPDSFPRDSEGVTGRFLYNMYH